MQAKGGRFVWIMISRQWEPPSGDLNSTMMMVFDDVVRWAILVAAVPGAIPKFGFGSCSAYCVDECMHVYTHA